MATIVIRRTRALQRFREKLGNPVRDLNSVIVGLCAVATGIAKKPPDLAVTWAPKDLNRAEADGRSFAIRSLMVMAYDSLDHYLADIAGAPSPISDERLRSVLSGELQEKVATAQIAQRDWDNLVDQLKTDHANRRRTLKLFAEKFIGTLERPSIRKRLSVVNEHCQALPTGLKAAHLRPSYFAAVELLLAWRNVLVHDAPANQLGSDAIEALVEDREYLRKEHAAVDIQMMMERFNLRRAPRLKEISTLVAILMRYLSGIDQTLLSACDIGVFFESCVRHELRELDRLNENSPRINKEGQIQRRPRTSLSVSWLGLSFETRLRKALGVGAPHGFVSGDTKAKAKEPQIVVCDQHLEFLQHWTHE